MHYTTIKSAQFCQICVVCSQSHLQDSRYWPGAMSFGTTTLSTTEKLWYWSA